MNECCGYQPRYIWDVIAVCFCLYCWVHELGHNGFVVLFMLVGDGYGVQISESLVLIVLVGLKISELCSV